eukprot:1181240-Prorocentrum_minimum.AAC.1
MYRLPSCDWFSRWVYTDSPPAIGSQVAERLFLRSEKLAEARERQRRQLEMEELRQCTFEPRINSDYVHRNDYRPLQVYSLSPSAVGARYGHILSPHVTGPPSRGSTRTTCTATTTGPCRCVDFSPSI